MIEVRNINKSYGNLQVLKNVSLRVHPGEVLGIIGPSGAGKTTLLQIIGTLESVDSGSLLYDGVAVDSLKDNKLAEFRNRNIGFVFQFHRLLPEFTLVENVMMPALISGKPMKEARKLAMDLITFLGLKDRASHKPAALSGGECQRAAVARALINHPKVILADEPTGSLDSRNRLELHKLFFNLSKEMGQTFVIVTHDESLAANCDRIARMADGRLVGIDEKVDIVL